MELVRISATAEETQALGRALSEIIEPGDVIALSGDLGAGKTMFVQGAARGLGVDGPIVSPTFTLVREYDGRIHVNHLDVYRLERLQDVIDLGFDEMLDSGGATFIEWGDVIEGLLSTDHLDVGMEANQETEARTITFSGEGVSWARRWDKLAAATAGWSAR